MKQSCASFGRKSILEYERLRRRRRLSFQLLRPETLFRLQRRLRRLKKSLPPKTSTGSGEINSLAAETAPRAPRSPIYSRDIQIPSLLLTLNS